MFCLSETWAGGDKPVYLPVEPTVKNNYREHGDASKLLGDMTFFKSYFFYIIRFQFGGIMFREKEEQEKENQTLSRFFRGKYLSIIIKRWMQMKFGSTGYLLLISYLLQ